MKTPKSTLLIGCGAVAHEIVSMIEHNGWDNLKIQCLPAKIHNTPQKIPEAIRQKIRANRDRFDEILVLFGDCGTAGILDKVLKEEGVERIPGAHCYEVLAGYGNFAEMMEKEPGSYFLTGFLARNFDRLVIKGNRLDKYPQMIARIFENYTRVVYLAHTDDPETKKLAEAAAKTLGLNFEMRLVGSGAFPDFVAAKWNLDINP
ncbi:MAG: DUF1638 domain-containing protein [Rhodobacteraceae bacterium]|nr:DUF1638 domain-containing protein [Paracoccaceae bacterium]